MLNPIEAPVSNYLFSKFLSGSFLLVNFSFYFAHFDVENLKNRCKFLSNASICKFCSGKI
jgi:hypothetical protein